MEREIVKELAREHFHRPHYHAHVPHDSLSHILSQPSAPLLPACVTASFAAHPVAWAVGGIAALGALAYLIFKD